MGGAGMIDVALVHYPVLNRQGEEIGAAVTGLDIHDIARTARTYGVERFFVVTPYQAQQELVRELVRHWSTGPGGRRNPDRGEALSLVRVAADLAEVKAAAGEGALFVATSAREGEGCLGWDEARGLALSNRRLVLLFGTANGLAPAALAQAHHRLAPIRGTGDYNHLPVRSAVARALDRLGGYRKPEAGRQRTER